MPEGPSSLIGSVFERKSTTKPSSSSPFTTSAAGFPAVQHRSKSLFARSRTETRGNATATRSRPTDVPKVVPAAESSGPSDDWRDQISRENEARVANMTDEERQEEIKDILERFGSGVGDILRKAREAREKGAGLHKANSTVATPPQVERTESLKEVPLTPQPIERRPPVKRVGSPPPALSTGHTRPNSRAESRTLRFAELSPRDVHVYPSAPPSPTRKPLFLLPPPDASESSESPVVSLGTFKGSVGRSARSASADEQASGLRDTSEATPGDPEEGTPEYIRRRFFPHLPPGDPSLAWIEENGPPDASSSSALRFDLTGTPIPKTQTTTLPTHLGLHHHAEGNRAGYTLDDVFLLTRSSVAAQRTVMMGVLSGITRWLRKLAQDPSSFGEEEGASAFVGKEEELRKRILAAGVEAMHERGSLGARAIEVAWECIVGWDLLQYEESDYQDWAELGDSGAKDAISTLPLEFFLPQIADAFALGALPRESLGQLLDIVFRLARHSNAIAISIVETPNLVSSIARQFLLMAHPVIPDPPSHSGDQSLASLPEPRALALLISLASASRENAAAIAEPADALLRFVTTLPPSSPYPLALAETLLTSTLRLYAVLASYGMYASIATTAVEHFTSLGKYVMSEACQSKVLIRRYLELLEAWIVCATDPHQTTPEHELLWSQVMGWAWAEDILSIRRRLDESPIFSGRVRNDWELWAATWTAEAAWLEGARINAVRGGELERATAIDSLKPGFERGPEKEMITSLVGAAADDLKACTSLDTGLNLLSQSLSTLTAAMRLWLACLPTTALIADSPPFLLPFEQLSQLSAKLATHPLWEWILDANRIRQHRLVHVHCRQLSTFLAMFSKMSRRLGASDHLWMAQAFAIVTRLLPGNELEANELIGEAARLVTRDFLHAQGIDMPDAVWDKDGLAVLQPFLSYLLKPKSDVCISPISPCSRSIKFVTTRRLPSPVSLLRERGKTLGLPLCRDWPFSPLDHLLRSGSSDVWTNMPPPWDASEVDVARATLILALVSRQLLVGFHLIPFALSREEAIFGCMKIFMLEHDQPHSDSSQEVFRDETACRLMNELLLPYSVSAPPPDGLRSLPSVETLDTVAARFLGAATPFYQYYTDFVALYDAVSFSHPIFARLLLPPTSMRYPIDFRRHLWNDFEHILRSIRTPISDIVAENVQEFLWPVERDAQMLSAYLRPLLRGTLEGCEFLRTVAVHHIACNIWPDLDEQGRSGSQETRTRLLKTIVFQGSMDLAKEVTLYSCAEGSVPEAVIGDERSLKRMVWLEGLDDKVFLERLGGLLHS